MKDLGKAIRLYRAVMDAHPEDQEAEYSRSQIQNIVSALVPKEELFDVCFNLTLKHIEDQVKTVVEERLAVPSSAGLDS